MRRLGIALAIAAVSWSAGCVNAPESGKKTTGTVVTGKQRVGWNGYALGEPGPAGDVVVLRIHTHVREDTIALYGFATALEQDLFERLIGISGIGPKLALSVLSGLEPSELVRAIERSDVAKLTGIPGVGKKTSERIVLELKDRLPRASTETAAAGAAVTEPPPLRGDVISALVNLGYHRPLAEKAAEAAIKIIGSTSDASFERVLKQALREVAK